MNLIDLTVIDCSAVLVPRYKTMPFDNAITSCIRLVIENYPNAYKTLLVWDIENGSKHRKRVYKQYKSNRSRDPERYKFLAKLQKIFYRLGYLSVKCSNKKYESDDIIALVCSRASENETITVVTRDTDMLSLIRDGVGILHDDGSSLEDKLKVEPSLINLYKATVGDSSDNIKGIHRFGEKSFEKMTGIYGIEGMLEITDMVRTNNWNDLIQQASELPDCVYLTSLINNWDTVRACFEVGGFYLDVVNTLTIAVGIPFKTSDFSVIRSFKKYNIEFEEIKEFCIEDMTADVSEYETLKKLLGQQIM
jgi:5'-3' exonuclease